MIRKNKLLSFSTSVFLAILTFSVQASERPRVDEALLPFKQQLQKALVTGMSEGAVEAISACKTEAPEIANSLSHSGVVVGRTSHRLRNLDNASPEWVEPILNTYLASQTDREPRDVLLPDGRTGYVEPIVVQPLCTTCHGDAITDEVATRINELYPADRAVGFKAGDLRGVFWVELPSEN